MKRIIEVFYILFMLILFFGPLFLFWKSEASNKDFSAECVDLNSQLCCTIFEFGNTKNYVIKCDKWKTTDNGWKISVMH